MTTLFETILEHDPLEGPYFNLRCKCGYVGSTVSTKYEFEKHLADSLDAAGFMDVQSAAVKALRDVADLAEDNTYGLDGTLVRERENRGFMQRHNVTAAARWIRFWADELERTET